MASIPIFALANNQNYSEDVIEVYDSCSYENLDVRSFHFKVRNELVDIITPQPYASLTDPYGWFFDTESWRVDRGPVFADVTFQTKRHIHVTGSSNGSGRNSFRRDKGVVWSMDISYEQRNIRFNKNYLSNWGYNLYYGIHSPTEDTSSLTIPLWYYYDKNETEDEGQYFWKWGKTTPSPFNLGDIHLHYVKIKTRTKPGDSYQVARQTIVGEQSFRDFGDAQEALDADNTSKCAKPLESFGLPYEVITTIGGSTVTIPTFLYMPDGIQSDGTWWLVTHRFIYNDRGYDNEIYDKTSNMSTTIALPW